MTLLKSLGVNGHRALNVVGVGRKKHGHIIDTT